MGLAKVARLRIENRDFLALEVDTVNMQRTPEPDRDVIKKHCEQSLAPTGLKGELVLVWRLPQKEIGFHGSPKAKLYFKHKTWKDIDPLFSEQVECDY